MQVMIGAVRKRAIRARGEAEPLVSVVLSALY